jgi:hypothetical protein
MHAHVRPDIPTENIRDCNAHTIFYRYTSCYYRRFRQRKGNDHELQIQTGRVRVVDNRGETQGPEH